MSKKRKKQPHDEQWDIANATTQNFKPYVEAPEPAAQPGPQSDPATPKLDDND